METSKCKEFKKVNQLFVSKITIEIKKSSFYITFNLRTKRDIMA